MAGLAWVAFSWVPLHAREVVEPEGFSHFSDRRRRLDLFLREYGSILSADGSLEVLRRRLRENIDAMRMTARSGDATYQRMQKHGVDTRLVLALEGLDEVWPGRRRMGPCRAPIDQAGRDLRGL